MHASRESTFLPGDAVNDVATLKVLLDLRNSYEYAYGYFEQGEGKGAAGGAATNSKCQYGLQEWARGPGAKLATRLAETGGGGAAVGGGATPRARVMMYCTGGVRCEKASSFLRASGVTCPIFQLSGGIHRYLEQYGSQGSFRGSNFIFDG
jgi:hypothetical protein